MRKTTAKQSNKISKTNNNVEITVQNAENEPDTKATILVQNKIDFEPKVSVIIPVYNVEEYLRQCLDSVINQTLKEIEIICVDDGSTDSSLEILKEYAAKDHRITLITQQNLHAGVARNAGLAVAKGEYLSFLDSDDFFELNMLEETYNKAIKDNSDIVIFNFYNYDNISKIEKTSYAYDKKFLNTFSPKKFKDYIYFISTPAPWNKIFKSSLIKNESLKFENLQSCNDITFVNSALSFATNISVVNKYFVHYRNNLTSNISANRVSMPINILLAFSKLKYNLLKKNVYNLFEQNFKTQLIIRAISEAKYSDSIVKDKFLEYCKNNFSHEVYKAIYDKVKISVSIIVPVYNTEKYLKECMDSLVNQSLKNIEIICINDASTDGSLEILKSYAKNDQRIRIINNTKNLGAPGAVKNIGLKVARGEYIGFVDSDDYVDINYFEELYNKAKSNDAEIASCLCLAYIQKNKSNKKQINCSEGVLITPEDKEKLISLQGANWNKIYSKKLIEKYNISCFEQRSIAEDNFFSVITMCLANKISTTSHCCYYYRKHDASITSHQRTKDDFSIFEVYKQIDIWLDKNKFYPKYKQIVYRRKLQDFIWFYKNIKSNDIEIFKNKLKNNFPDIYKGIFNVIISLTSFPERINTVNQTIESLLNQEVKANKIILWLAPEQFPNKEADLPKQLLNLKEKGLIIDWYHDIRSYKKLIPTLKKYPDSIIITADDDIIYNKTCVKTLINTYYSNIYNIIANRITRLYYKEKNLEILPRKLYTKNNTYLPILKQASCFNMQTGCAAVLYPPHCFYKDILNEDLIQKLAPTNDDQWFWAMGILNGFSVMMPKEPQFNLKYVENTQEGSCLWKINDKGDKLYFKDLKKILEHYTKLKNILLLNNYQNNKALSFLNIFSIPFKQLTLWYKNVTGKELNLNEPKNYNEKMQWLKIFNATPIKTLLADKYLVREWIKEKIGEKYLIPLLGVYDKFEDINFDKLPNQFVIKCNHGSGWNIIVKDKSKLDLSEAKEKINRWLNTNFAFQFGYELHYRDIKPKIIIEKYIDPKISNHEIQVWCFNGAIKFISLETNKDENNLKRGTFYPDGTPTEFEISPQHYKKLEKISSIKAFNKAIELSKFIIFDTPYVRIDFIEMNDDVKFREITFTSGSGLSIISPEKYNLMLGNMIKLPELAYNIDTGEYFKLPKNLDDLDDFNNNLSQLDKSTLSYKLFNFIPLFTLKQRNEKKVWKIFGLPIFKTLKYGTSKAKYYILGIPILKIRQD